MRRALVQSALVWAGIVGGLGIVGCGSSAVKRASTSSNTGATGSTATLAKPLPAGCNLDITSQTIGAVVDHDDAFQFNGYNAVRPGDPITGTSISWGDGTTSRGAAATRVKPFAPGCLQTVFTGHHKYTRVTCAKGICATKYDVTIRYEDARTRARHTLTKLRVVIIRGRS
jgi:hypothetical protein